MLKAIPVNPDLGTQAQAFFNTIGLDVATVVDYILRQIMHHKDTISFEAVRIDSNSLFDFSNIKGKPAKLGGWEGKVKMADDFNAPIDDFEEYM